MALLKAIGFLVLGLACLGGGLYGVYYVVTSPSDDHPTDFGYLQGGDDWTNYPKCINGTRQSPIEISTSSVIKNKEPYTHLRIVPDEIHGVLADKNVTLKATNTWS
eukprot:80294_1